MRDPSATILLVEDNEDDLFVMQRSLKLAEVANPLQVVTDGQMALDYLSGTGEYGDRERHPIPSMIFLDLKLPYVSGFEVLDWMRLQPDLCSVDVVVLTSSDEERDQTRAYALGARSYLVKPPSPKTLRDILN